MNKRLNISLPEEAVRRLDDVAPKGERSGFILKAINKLFDENRSAHLRRELELETDEWADVDLELANESFALSDD